MMKKVQYVAFILAIALFIAAQAGYAQNPLIRDQFTADPTARVFEGKMYLYPSHDIPPAPGTRENWFCMEDYHVFSSENLTDWKDHGVIVSQTMVPWVRPSYNMWAPDCVEKDGKYYFFFPANNRIGIAISDKPYGPFKPQDEAIAGLRGGIDPCVLIDTDGSAYLYYSMNAIFVVKLKPNMTEIDGEVLRIPNLPTQGLIEGPFTFKRNGIYYLTYPHVENETERIEYATSDNPMGPFTPKGVIMDETPSGCWTNHHSIVEYQDQWYFFYHDKDYSPDFDKNRAARADYLYFNEDGTIQKVIPTLRGVGINSAQSEIQVDRYSEISEEGAKVEFNNPEVTFEGWKTVLSADDAWIRYNKVDFGEVAPVQALAMASSAAGGTIEIRVDAVDGPLVAEVEIPEGESMRTACAKTDEATTGIHDVFVVLKGDAAAEVDWVKFE